MMKALWNWVDDRTGIRKLWKEALFESVPGGARWRYVWGSTLTFAIMVQFITGVVLWMAYSASAQTAWESVYYVQEVMPFGDLLRGIHHWTAQLMVVLLVLHLMQVLIDKAYKAPREFNFWFGVLLLFLTLAISLTGYLLPWDQKGYWATKVATNLTNLVPVVGDDIQKVVIGGTDYGHHTLTRFFALHAGVLPGLLVLLIVVHIYLFRRHGITPAKSKKKRRDGMFWPDQIFRDAIACAIVLAVVVGLTVWVGTGLTAPADPSSPYDAARPDWYFMSLFMFLELPIFAGTGAIWGAIIIPGIVAGIVFFLPILGRWELGHRFNLVYAWACIAAFIGLTAWGFIADGRNEKYQFAKKLGDEEAARVKELIEINGGIPPEGALSLLLNDAKTQGPKIFAARCASCHAYDGHNGMGLARTDEQSGADLKGFASREWLEGLLDPEKITTPHYFGNTAHVSVEDGGTGKKNSKMTAFILEDFEASEEEVKTLAAALSAQAKLKYQADIDERDKEMIEKGWGPLIDDIGCLDCHSIEDDDGSALDLAGYGSRQWMIDFIADPEDDRFYGKKNDRMPAFGREGKEILPTREIEMVVDWIRGEWPELKPEESEEK